MHPERNADELVIHLTLVPSPASSHRPIRAALYSATDLGTLGGAFTYAHAMNASGQVVGYSELDDGSVHAFLYDPAHGMQDLTLRGGQTLSVQAINNAGLMTGSMNVGGASHLFRWSGQGAVQDLGALNGDYAQTIGTSINASGQISGWARTDFSSDTHAFVYDGATLRDLNTLGQSSSAVAISDTGRVTGDWHASPTSGGRAFLYDAIHGTRDIGIGGTGSSAQAMNKSGQIVGNSATAGNAQYHPMLYSGDGPMQDLGTLGGTYGYASGISENGLVVGSSYTTGNGRFSAFLFDGVDPMQDLGSLGGFQSEAWQVNSSGVAVGWSSLADNFTFHAWVYAQGQLMDLNTFLPPGSDVTLTNARFLSETGYILADGIDTNGNDRQFLFTSVPEPSAALLLAAAALCVTTRSRRRLTLADRFHPDHVAAMDDRFKRLIGMA